MLRYVGSQGALTQQVAPRIRSLNWTVTSSTQNLEELGQLLQKEETHNTPDKSKDVPEVVDFQRCKKAEIDWYVWMPTDLPPADPKVEMLPELCEEKCSNILHDRQLA